MVFQPGYTGNPSGGANHPGPRRHRHTLEVIREINRRGYQDPLVTLAQLSVESQDEGMRQNAATSLAPFMHPKMQAVPTPRYLEEPIEVPEFTTVEEATAFIAKIDSLTANRKLDFQSATELVAITKTFIDSKVASDLEARVAALELQQSQGPDDTPSDPAPTT
jgi:hypothetical protein